MGKNGPLRLAWCNVIIIGPMVCRDWHEPGAKLERPSLISGVEKLTRSSLKTLQGVSKQRPFDCKRGSFASGFFLSGTWVLREKSCLKSRPPPPPGASDSPFPHPEQKKIKNIRNVHQETGRTPKMRKRMGKRGKFAWSKMSEQLSCRSAEVKIFSFFLCQRCREIWREILVKFSALCFPGFGCATENFTKKRCEKRKSSHKFHSAEAQRSKMGKKWPKNTDK